MAILEDNVENSPKSTQKGWDLSNSSMHLSQDNGTYGKHNFNVFQGTT